MIVPSALPAEDPISTKVDSELAQLGALGPTSATTSESTTMRRTMVTSARVLAPSRYQTGQPPLTPRRPLRAGQLVEPPRTQSKESTCTRYDAAGTAAAAVKYARLPAGTLPRTHVDDLPTTVPEASRLSMESCIRSAGMPGFKL